MRNLLLLAILLSSKISFSQNLKSIPTKSDSIVFYLYDGLMGQHIIEENILDTTIVFSKKLNINQNIEINKILSGKIRSRPKSICNSQAACFSPHHGIVYYKHGQQIGHISVCFACNGINSNLEIKTCAAQLIDFTKELHLKIGTFEYIPKLYKNENESGLIQKMNIKRYGRNYMEKRHNL